MKFFQQLAIAILLSVFTGLLSKQMSVAAFNELTSILSILAMLMAVYVNFITVIYVFIKNGKYYSGLVKHLVSFGLILTVCYTVLGILWHLHVVLDLKAPEQPLLDALYHVLDIFHAFYYVAVCYLLSVIYIKKSVVPFMRVKDCGCIGEFLIQLGYVKREQLEEALKLQRTTCED